ncbi:amidohydrolase family protein [Aporhodopirellula aestuarii]|uniref:Amidohydrolase family protein n=1 Tax=Aporhodopirellula aestuarii TaxID=2950107 RepID=A0ABT0TZH2_9BACT|nr:amidohydrolase family protein [Aporhodopirellula aestuarii]MCM2369975.1 amidohydrolase family protein [Aporhodopirellula aestuarii]
MRNRRAWFVVVFVCTAGWGLAGGLNVCADEPPKAVESANSEALRDDVLRDLDIIDCHTHFYDPSRPEGVPWPSKNSSLYRTVLPEHLRSLEQFRPVTGTVIVEASSRVDDNAWLLDLAADDPFIVGIVGRLQPGTADFPEQLQRFAANPLFRGIRISVGLLKEMLAEDLQGIGSLNDLALLAERDLSLDVNGGPETPAAVAKLAEKIPNLRIVVNHIGNVAITSAPPADWVEAIRAAAKHPNVFCKVSGLVESASHHSGRPAPDDLEFYRPYFDVVWDAFGEDRVIYASNWPVSERGASYEMLQRLVMHYVAERGRVATQKFASLNAKNAYKWLERPGRIIQP